MDALDVYDLAGTPGYGSRSFEFAERDVNTGRRRRDVHGFRDGGYCELCNAGPCTFPDGNVNKQVVRQHERGRKHIASFDRYNQGYDAYLSRKEDEEEIEHARVCRMIESKCQGERSHVLLLSFVKEQLCSRFGSLDAGRAACDDMNDELDLFMKGPACTSSRPGWHLWRNCLYHAASNGHIILELVMARTFTN